MNNNVVEVIGSAPLMLAGPLLRNRAEVSLFTLLKLLGKAGILLPNNLLVQDRLQDSTL